MPRSDASDTTPRRLRYRYRFTRLGIHFVFVAVFSMVGGSIRGFNLLLVLAGVLVAVLIVQWRCSRRAIESLAIERRLPSEAFAGTPFQIRYLVRNLSKWQSVWMIRVDDWVQWIDGPAHRVSCGLGLIAPRQTQPVTCDCVVSRRGKYRLESAKLSTSFPFALVTASQVDDTVDEMFVYPELLTLQRGWEKRILSQHGGMATTARRSGPDEGEFFGLREWKSGDSLRRIHWRTTARMSSPAVRQFEQEHRFDICILVDAYLDPTDRSKSKQHFVETAISLAATLVTRLVGTPANRIIVVTAGMSSEAIICGMRNGKHAALRQLAALELTDRPRWTDALENVHQIAAKTQNLLVVSTRTLNEVVAAHPESEPLLALEAAEYDAMDECERASSRKLGQIAQQQIG